jgi:uracil-DNA glycosylase
MEPRTENNAGANAERIKLESSWKALLIDEFQKPYMQNLREFLRQEYAKGKTIYPPKNEIFAALNLTPFDKVKAVIVGQDPYHGPGQAHGLCFSVREGVQAPPSLQNIVKEIKAELGVSVSIHGNLTSWAKQGVLLLNATLTVEAGRPASHANKGWETFTDRIIQLVSEKKEHVIFILWGSYAQKKEILIDEKKHLILKSAHPSPLSCHRGFFGNKHFTKTNDYLKRVGLEPIDWRI